MRGIALLWCVACAPLAVPRSELSGESSLHLVADVDPPYELSATVVVVDGEVIARSPGRSMLRLSAGPHELAIAASLTRPCDLAAEQSQRTRVRAIKTLEVGAHPVEIEAHVSAGAVTAPELEVLIDGARVTTAVAEPGCCQLELVEPARTPPPDGCRAPPDAGVLVTGEVQHPRELQWQHGMTAYDAIVGAGGATRLANLRYTTVQRRCGEVIEVPWYSSVTSLLLQPGDDVIVRMTPDP